MKLCACAAATSVTDADKPRHRVAVTFTVAPSSLRPAAMGPRSKTASPTARAPSMRRARHEAGGKSREHQYPGSGLWNHRDVLAHEGPAPSPAVQCAAAPSLPGAPAHGILDVHQAASGRPF